MPSHEEHCSHSQKRYGVRGDEIHTWMDEPSSVAGASHRDYRHNLTSLPTAIQMFQNLFGADMVENIFLDHLKADSEESRKQEKRIDVFKKWSESEDSYLKHNFLYYSDEEFEAYFQDKSKSEIRIRREYFGLIRPKIIPAKRTQIIFKLTRGQKISVKLKIEGGNNDIDFGLFYYQKGMNNSRTIYPLERIFNSKDFNFNIEMSGNYNFIVDVLGVVFSKKVVHFAYKLDEGVRIDLALNPHETIF
jgi:hypothetical protein